MENRIEIKKYNVSSKRKDLYRLTYTLHDYYNNLNENYGLSKKQYLDIMMSYFEYITDNIVYDRKYYDLPVKNGRLRIKKCKQNASSPFKRLNEKLTKEHNVNIYYTNLHTNGYYFRWFWDKKKIISHNKCYYSFKPSVDLKNKLSKEIIDCSKNPYKKDYDALS